MGLTRRTSSSGFKSPKGKVAPQGISSAPVRYAGIFKVGYGGSMSINDSGNREAMTATALQGVRVQGGIESTSRLEPATMYITGTSFFLVHATNRLRFLDMPIKDVAVCGLGKKGPTSRRAKLLGALCRSPEAGRLVCHFIVFDTHAQSTLAMQLLRQIIDNAVASDLYRLKMEEDQEAAAGRRRSDGYQDLDAVDEGDVDPFYHFGGQQSAVVGAPISASASSSAAFDPWAC